MHPFIQRRSTHPYRPKKKASKRDGDVGIARRNVKVPLGRVIYFDVHEIRVIPVTVFGDIILRFYLWYWEDRKLWSGWLCTIFRNGFQVDRTISSDYSGMMGNDTL
uniref:Uncharacterized protein n=1 Tax=Onchocerca volvulus TaxID=6282 RepID=A0A8R1TZ52_ONCVO